ncbi:MAG: protein-disulfide reductase DsbD family protein [Candidatus Binatia bacterium]
MLKKRLPHAASNALRQSGPCMAALLVVLAFLAPTARAAGVAWAQPVVSANVSAELLSEQETIRPGEPFTVGVALRPAPGWHTYWQNPGDSGYPTTVEWTLPAGLKSGDLEWPHPVRLGMPPLVTYGYEGDVLLLARLEAPASLRAGSHVDLVAKTRFLSCREDACIPGKAALSLRIAVENTPPHRDSRWSEAFDAARARLPRRLEGWRATAAEQEGRIRIEVVAPGFARPSTTGIQVYPMTANILDASAQTSVTATEAGFVIEAPCDEKAEPLPETLGLVLVAEGGWDAAGGVHALRVDAQRIGGPPAAAGVVGDSKAEIGAGGAVASAELDAAAASPEAVRTAEPAVGGTNSLPASALPGSAVVAGVTFWVAIGLAFLGGLVLNLMPCVFPVLSLKVLGFLHVAHHEAALVRRHGYAFAAGVLVSFWVLAGLLIALRAAGGALGWGFQLQEPLFVAAIAALLTAMALNLFGVFEFGSSLSGAVGRFDSESGYRGSFLSGVVATVLATPCSAPFMGTAIGFALAQPAIVSLAVFTSLGAGMAAPYLVLSCVPALLRRLPRPGPWMETFRQLMAFPLLATVAWLVWVFGQQAGNDGVLRLMLALLLGSMGAWALGRFRDGHAHFFARAFGGACIVGAVLLVALAASPSPTSSMADTVHADGVEWLAWDPEAIPRHRSEGRVVFVDFTADWCLSCKVNERVALTGEEFAESIRAHSAIVMKADWTRADPRITEALAAFGRSGVPLYVVYPRDPAREPIVLPQLLTPAIVRAALDSAAA